MAKERPASQSPSKLEGDGTPQFSAHVAVWFDLLAQWRALRLAGQNWIRTSPEAKNAAALTRKLAAQSRLLAVAADQHLHDASGPIADFASDLDELCRWIERTNGPWGAAQRISSDIDDRRLPDSVARVQAKLCSLDNQKQKSWDASAGRHAKASAPKCGKATNREPSEIMQARRREVLRALPAHDRTAIDRKATLVAKLTDVDQMRAAKLREGLSIVHNKDSVSRDVEALRKQGLVDLRLLRRTVAGDAEAMGTAPL